MRFASRRVWLAPILLLAAFAARVIGLDAQSFWYDEGYSVMLAQQDAGRIIVQTASLDFNTPLHYLLLRIWTGLAGMSEFSARLLSVFAGVVTVALATPLVTLPARHRHRAWAARATATLLLALSPALISLAQEARMYALLGCLCALSVAQLVRSLRARAWHSWMLWAIWNLAAFFTHVIGAIFFAAQALLVGGWWLWHQRSCRSQSPLPLAVTALAGAAMGAFVLYILSFGRSYGVSYGVRLDFLPIFSHSLAAMLLPRLEPSQMIPLAAIGAAGALTGLLFTLWRTRGRAMTWAAGVCVTAVVAISAFCAYTGKFAARYPAVLAPLLLAGTGMALATWPGRVALPVGSALAALSVVGLFACQTAPVYRNEDFRGAAAFVRAQARPDERVVLVSGHFAPVFAYYYGDTGWIAVPNDPVLDINHVLDYDLAASYLNHHLAGASGAWLLEWQQEVIDPTHIVTELLRRQTQGRAYQEIAGFHNLRLRHFRFAQPYQPTPRPVPLQSRVDTAAGLQHGLGALGCHSFDPPRVGDATMEVACFWTLARFSGLPLDTRVSLRLVNSAGAWVAQSDQYLAAPYGLPNATVDKSLAAFYVMEIPPDLPAGPYTLQAVPYIRTGPEETLEIAPRVYTPARIAPGAR